MSSDLKVEMTIEAAAKNNLAAALNAEAAANLADLAIETYLPTDVTPLLVAWECGKGEIETLVVPNGVTKIGPYVFDGRGVKNLILSDDVEVIGACAFAIPYMGVTVIIHSSLQTVTFGGSSKLKTLGDSAFAGLDNPVELPHGLETIGRHSLAVTKNVTIPSTVKSIHEEALALTNEVTFRMPMSEVMALENYPWSMSSGAVIHCTDGDITL